MENSKHTPLPWEFTKWDGEAWPEKRWSVGSRLAGRAICVSLRNYKSKIETPEEDGKFIVRACNSHYELLEALKEIEKLCDNKNPSHERIWRTAYSVIKKAEGQ